MSYFLTRTRTQTEYQYFEKLKLALILFSIFEKTRNFSNIRKWGIFLTRTRTRFIFKFQKNSKLTLTYKNEEINWLKLFLTRVFWEKNNSNSRKKIPRVRKKNSHFFEKSAFSDFNSLVCFLLHSESQFLVEKSTFYWYFWKNCIFKNTFLTFFNRKKAVKKLNKILAQQRYFFSTKTKIFLAK